MLAEYRIIFVNNTDDERQVIVFNFFEGSVTSEDEDFEIEDGIEDGIVVQSPLEKYPEGVPEVISVTRYRPSSLLEELTIRRDSQLSIDEINNLGMAELVARYPDHDLAYNGE